MRTGRHRAIPLGVLSGLLVMALQGCGLVYDAVQYVRSAPGDELDRICRRQQLRVGITPEPFRPLIFPVVRIGQRSLVTGLDVELIREVTGALSRHCGGHSVSPLLQPVPFRNLAMDLNEGKVDLFISVVGASVPAPARSGVAYSLPYLSNGGVTAIVQRPEILARVRASLEVHGEQPPQSSQKERALAGLSVAVQEGTSAHLYAVENLKESRLLVFDSLPAAFESDDSSIDVILGSYPIFEFVTKRVRKKWQLITLDNEKPFLLTREQYALVMPEQSYRLRWAVNKLLLQLEETGRLAEMQKRWFEEEYVFPERALTEGLPVVAEKVFLKEVPERHADPVRE
jgi:polar amino acid transport system substrate-binding protein